MPQYNFEGLPNPKEATLGEIVEHFERELRKVEDAMTLVDQGRQEIRKGEPSKPREGQLVYADGTNWNPGAGEGYYFHDGSGWVPLGGRQGGDLYLYHLFGAL